MLNGLTTVNIELTSRCNKKCWCCGRRKIEKEYPELAKWGDMPIDMVRDIAKQLPLGVVVQLHNNGEPLLYPYLTEALYEFRNQIRCFNTNGKLLKDRYITLQNMVDVVTVSVIENDPEADEQFEILQWVAANEISDTKPRIVLRLLGNVDEARYKQFLWPIVHRILHSPMGSFQYRKPVTIPEIGICLDALNHLSIDRNGLVSMCVRFDPHHENVIGNVNEQSLEEIWNGDIRQWRVANHVSGKRNHNALCAKCEYWGVPTG